MAALQCKLVEISQGLRERRIGKQIHTSFIVHRKKILSIGINARKTHPMAAKFGYTWQFLHSELDAILKMESLADLHRMAMYNVRLDRTGKPALSRPCKQCQKLLLNFGFSTIIYTTENGWLEYL